MLDNIMPSSTYTHMLPIIPFSYDSSFCLPKMEKIHSILLIRILYKEIQIMRHVKKLMHIVINLIRLQKKIYEIIKNIPKRVLEY